MFSKGKERAKRDRENLVKECGQRILHDDLASSQYQDSHYKSFETHPHRLSHY